MRLFIQLILFLWVALSLLVIASLMIGKSADYEILTAKDIVDDQVYLLYVADSTFNIRINLAGYGCFKAPPPITPHPNGDSVSPQQLQHRRLVLQRTSLINEMRDIYAFCK